MYAKSYLFINITSYNNKLKTVSAAKGIEGWTKNDKLRHTYNGVHNIHKIT